MSRSEPIDEHTPTEELANAVTHGIGAVLSLMALLAMVARAAGSGDGPAVAAAAAFGASLVALYLASATYHAVPWPTAKRRLRAADHVAIYFLIAGTYTPFALVTMRGTVGVSLLALVWALALAGAAFELLTKGRRMRLALVFYLALGWVAVLYLGPLAATLPARGLAALVAGGVLYTAGVGFYVWKRLPFSHAIWHLFVLAGSACHVWCVLDSVL
jgi:hemolysin III